MAVWCCSGLLALSLGVLLAAWWLAGRDVPASYDCPPVTNADGSVFFDHANLLMPSSVEEIVEIVQSANQHGRKIRVLGAGHSRSAIAHSRDIYLSLYNFRGIVNIDRDSKRVVVRAGTLLKDFNKELRRKGLALPNLPTLGDQTIGGALAVGSHGTGLNYGNLATIVTNLSYISGTGRLISVNASTDANLFKAALVSLGMIGVVTEVTFECEEAHNLRENITIFPVEHCLQNLPHFSTQSDHGKFWIEAHSGVCASFSVWKTTQPVTEEQGVQLWDIKNRISEPLLWLGSWFPSINPHIVSFLYNNLRIFTPYERIDASEDVLIPPLYVPPNNQLEFGVDMKDCVSAVGETVRLARNNPHTNMFTEVRYVKKDDIFLSPSYQRDSCQVTIIIYTPSSSVLLDYFQTLCKTFSRFSARPHWAKYLCGLKRSQLNSLYPGLEEFAKIRAEMDPRGVFINEPLMDLFDFEVKECLQDSC